MSDARVEQKPSGPVLDAQELSVLQAYHDGELSGFGRWRFERRLSRSPELQQELESLAQIGDLMREADSLADGPSAEPDLWAQIAMRLPAEDARRDEVVREAAESGGGSFWGGVFSPARAAAAAAVALAVALAIGLPDSDPGASGVVRWVDSGDRSVMVLEDAADMTIIWVLDPPSADPEAAWTGGSGGVV